MRRFTDFKALATESVKVTIREAQLLGRFLPGYYVLSRIPFAARVSEGCRYNIEVRKRQHFLTELVGKLSAKRLFQNFPVRVERNWSVKL